MHTLGTPKQTLKNILIQISQQSSSSISDQHKQSDSCEMPASLLYFQKYQQKYRLFQSQELQHKYQQIKQAQLIKYDKELYEFSVQLTNSSEIVGNLQAQASYNNNNRDNVSKIDINVFIFVKNITQISIDWIDLLVNDGISSETQQITINRSSTLTKLYQGLMKRVDEDIQSRISNSQSQCNSYKDKLDNINAKNGSTKFQLQYVNETSLALIAQVMNTYAVALVQCFKYGKRIIMQNVQKIDHKIKESQIINSYIVFGMLKQMSSDTKQLILHKIDQVFPNLPLTKCQQFCKYIQKNYENMELTYIQSGSNYIYTLQQMVKYQEEKNKKWLNFLKQFVNDSNDSHMKMKKIESIGGQNGILLQRKSSSFSQNLQDNQKLGQNQQQSTNQLTKSKQSNRQSKDLKDNEQLILKVQQGKQIKVINAKVCQQSWRIFDNHDSMSDLFETFKRQIEHSGKKKNKDYISYGVPTCQFATIGGSLGKCLADINKYHSANQFFIDLSKDAAISSAFSVAISQIPIISYFIIAGGLSYSFYKTCKNQVISAQKKANQMGSVTMGAFMSIGSTLGGIVLGQTVIPVPFLGAFIGGVAGAFLGTKGARQANNFLIKTNFRQLISYMKQKMIEDRCWMATQYMLQKIGIDQKYFNEHTPSDENSKNVYITAICFCIATFYQSRRYIKYNENKVKQQKQKQQNNNKATPIQNKQQHGNILKQQQQNILQNTSKQIQKLEKQQKQNAPFQNQFNLVKIIQYLQQQKFNILQNLDALELFVSHIVK